VVEVTTLRDTASCTLSSDLRHLTYSSALLASISRTTIAYCDINKQIILRHRSGEKLQIQQAMTSRTRTPRQHVSITSSPKRAKGKARAEQVQAEAKAETEAEMKSKIKPTDLGETPRARDRSFHDRQMMKTTLSAQDIANKSALVSNSNIQSNQVSKTGVKEGKLTQKCALGAESLPLFAKMPLEPLEFRFAVSLLSDSDLSDVANSMLIRSSSGYLS
jgi:hypothetical protein